VESVAESVESVESVGESVESVAESVESVESVGESVESVESVGESEEPVGESVESFTEEGSVRTFCVCVQRVWHQHLSPLHGVPFSSASSCMMCFWRVQWSLSLLFFPISTRGC